MNRLTLALTTACCLVLACTPAVAATWNEAGDALQIPAQAQITAGAGPLTQIDGSFTGIYDIDMYCIKVDNEGAFFARLFCMSYADPDLWLFDAAGNGVAMDDGCMGGFTDVSSAFVGSNGTYYVAVSATNVEAIDAGALPIWNPPVMPSERAPDGPGAPGPVIGWSYSNPVVTSPTYSILLSGATFCAGPVAVQNATWANVKVLY